MKKILASTLACLALAALTLTTGCLKSPFSRTEAKEQNRSEAAVPVEVAPLQRGPIETVIQRSTHLEAEAEVKVFARTANRITELLVEEGDLVTKNQVLLQMEDDIQNTQFEKAQSNLQKSTDEFQRSKSLYDQNLISEQAFLDIKFQLRQHELALEDARREFDYTRVLAPIAGTITRRMVKTGDLVAVNHHLFDIVDFSSIVARIHVPERELPRLAVGQQARVTSAALPGRETIGVIQRIAPVVDTVSGTVKVTISFQDVGPLLPGMYVVAEVVTAQNDQALLISRRALVYDSDLTFAYRLQTNRTVERILVEEKLADAEHVEPAKGFNEGDLIVVAGQTGLRDGAKVRLPEDPDPDAEDEADPAKPDSDSKAQTDSPKPESDTAPDPAADQPTEAATADPGHA